MARKYHWTVTVDGADLIAEGGIATTFDDHSTSSGTPADTDGCLGCSLPTGRCAATAGSPFPKLPWHTRVRVFYPATNRHVDCELIDEGPSWAAQAGMGEPGWAMIDLTPAAKLALGFAHKNDNGPVRIRIFGGAAHI